MKGKIRIAMRKDIPAITELFNNGQDALMGETEGEYTDEDIEDYLNNKVNKIFVCELEEEIIGAFLVQFWKNYFFLHTIVIREDSTDMGIEEIFLDYIERLAKERKKYSIELFTEIRSKKMQSSLKQRDYEKGNKFMFYSKKIK